MLIPTLRQSWLSIVRCRNCRTTFKGITINVYQRSKPLRFFVNVNQFIKIVNLFRYVARYFCLLCNVLKAFTCDIKKLDY